MRSFLLLKAIVKYSVIVNQVCNHIKFMRLHDTVYILYRVHVRIDFISDSSCDRVDGKAMRYESKPGSFESGIV